MTEPSYCAKGYKQNKQLFAWARKDPHSMFNYYLFRAFPQQAEMAFQLPLKH